MMRRYVAILLFGIFLPGSALAESKFYSGVYFGEGDLGTYSREPVALDFKFGREFGKYIAVELSASIAADDAEDIFKGPEVKAVGGYLRLNLPLNRVNLYVLGGASRVQYDIPNPNLKDTEQAGGFGIDLLANEDNMLTIERVVYNYDSVLEYSVVHIGFTHRFNFSGLR